MITVYNLYCVFQGPHFREWLLTKVINGEQVCYRAPKFAKLHVSTVKQISGGGVGSIWLVFIGKNTLKLLLEVKLKSP